MTRRKLHTALMASVMMLSEGIGGQASGTVRVDYCGGFQLSDGNSYVFPDFVLIYKGQRPGPFYPGSQTHRLGNWFDFQADAAGQRVMFSWSSGTGELGPTLFKISGRSFALTPYRPPDMTEDFNECDIHAPSDGSWFCCPV